MKKYILSALMVQACVLAIAQEDKPNETMEFSHPLITESISPDTKVRFTFLDTKSSDGIMSQIYDLEVEVAPVPVFSVHLDVPYVILHPEGSQTINHLDVVEIDLKFANFAFSKQQILMGYGISFGFPTGDQIKGIGNDHIWNVNPFFNGGVKWRNWQWTAFLTFGIPCNQKAGEDMQTGLELRFTANYRINRKWEALAEAGNATQISRFYQGENNYDITEGIKFTPNPSKPWIFAIGLREPFFRNDEIKLQGIISFFYHFKDK